MLRKTSLVFGALALATVTHAQAIAVRIDDRTVTFTGQGPAQVQGRVLVPLRGIMEALGATVKFDGATQAITAVRGSSTLGLTLGRREASIDGRLVTLDVPAQTLNGSTMVPLRFVAEALGVGVNWQGATNTVLITTSGSGAVVTPPSGGTQPPAAPGAPTITGFTTSAAQGQWLRPGERLAVTLSGTSGGTASFTIPGVVERVELKETRAGIYEGAYQVPARGAVGLGGANVIGRLTVNGKDQLIQGATPVAFDPDAPAISAFSPGNGDRIGDRRPNISAAFSDAAGSGIDRASLKLTIDGKDVTSATTRGEGLLVYAPREDLAVGAHTATVVIGDQAGNSTKKTWGFTVADASTLVKAFMVMAGENPTPGDVITLRLEGEPGARSARYDIGTKILDRPLTETSPGVYTAEYTVRRDDAFAKDKVVARFTSASGETLTIEAKTTVGNAAIAPPVPTITSPIAGKTKESEITVTGSAPRADKVEITVEYTTLLLGAFRSGGTLSTTTVTPDDNGGFTSAPISLKISLDGKGTKYTVSVVSIAADGTRSEPQTVKLTK